MNKSKGINFFDDHRVSFKLYKTYLKHQIDRTKVLNETAIFLLNTEHTSKRILALKKKFFETYALELAGNCGCSEVLPDHYRIQPGEHLQLLIEMMNAARIYNFLGEITIKQLARILVCIFDCKYDHKGMINRLKSKNPDYEEIYNKIVELPSCIRKKI